MAFVPGENLFPSQIPTSATPNIDVESLIGSGINAVKLDTGVEDLSLALVAGANISLNPSLQTRAITIARSVPASIGAVLCGNGSSVVEQQVPPNSINLTRALREPTNGSIVLNPSPTTKDLTIINNQKRTTTQNSGITLSGGPPSYSIQTSLVAGSGVSILPIFPLNQQKDIVNTGVRSITAGTGLSVNTTTGNVVINSTNPVPPNTTAVAGSGLNQSIVGNQRILTANLTSPNNGFTFTNPGGTQIQINNGGILSLVNGPGITTSLTTQNWSIFNDGVKSITSTTPAIQNIGNATDVNLKFNDPTQNQFGLITLGQQGTLPNSPLGINQTGSLQIFVNSSLLSTHLKNGDPSNPDSVWALDLSPFLLELQGTTANGFISFAVAQSGYQAQIPVDNQISFLGSQNIVSADIYCNPGVLLIKPSAFASTFPGNFGQTITLVITNQTNRVLSASWYNPTGYYAYYYPKGVE